MRIENVHIPKSSFLSVDKDLSIIVEWMLKDKTLKKLLYYTTKEALAQKDLTDEQSISLISKNIRIVPKLYVDNSVLAYIIISMDNFTPNSSNPEFRDNVISFDIICHFDQWELTDFQLRPYKIAAELDDMFNNKHLTGIGTLQFMAANQLILTDEFAGLSLMYSAVHGEDDKLNAVNPDDTILIEDNYADLHQDDDEPRQHLDKNGRL